MGSLDRRQLQELYRYLHMTRSLEERLETLFKQGHIAGGLYRSLGQEATAVGSAYALEEGDWVAPSIRDMGALLVRGLDPVEMFLQYTARADAPTGGKDTTTHFTLPELGFLGPVSPLGTQVCVLNGVALAFRMRGEDRVGLVFQGDGASRTGAFHEGMNFAAVQRFPVVVVLEHNRWAFSTPSDEEAAVESWSDVGKAYGVPTRQVDGNDVLAVHDAVEAAVDRARGGKGASLIVAETYRMLGHAQHDPQPYVDEAELEQWRQRDPLDRYRAYLLEHELATEAELEAIRDAVDEELEAAAAEAVEAPRPEPEEARWAVYAERRDGDTRERPAPVPWTRRRVVGYDDLRAAPAARGDGAGPGRGRTRGEREPARAGTT